MKPAILLVFILCQVLPVRGKFKEICERPNGSCQRYCIETEVYVGQCLDNRFCCLPLGKHPRIENTTPRRLQAQKHSSRVVFALLCLKLHCPRGGAAPPPANKSPRAP
ncbi:beta-defensin 108B-like [Perognathus longimembris pacificus]|uniref:beta-defensin 108B-like n=1 Tax=Perognathus longimembris pacificus TaxID=214514 RepID=UPI0020199DCA|nr:beta-defensin 108B-like [Perognathus longimembris pacificus]